MNMKVTVTASKPGGFRGGVVVITMFAALLRSVVAQQVVSKADRAPRVYNALITSNQELLPSQADPIFTPVFEPFRYFYDWPLVYAAPYPVLVVPSTLSSSSSSSLSPVQDSEAVLAPAAADASPKVENVAKAEPRRPADVFMNNRPSGSSIPDVPPPPLPFVKAGKKDKKGREEYPPAPVGFAI